MSEETVSDSLKKNTDAVVSKVVNGTADAAKLKEVSRTLQFGLSSTLVSGIQDLYQNLDSISGIAGKFVKYFNDKIEAELSNKTLSFQEAFNYIKETYDLRIKVIDLYRKIAQGKELFPSDSLSDDVKMVVELLDSFKSKSEKIKFLKLAKETLGSNLKEDASPKSTEDSKTGKEKLDKDLDDQEGF